MDEVPGTVESSFAGTKDSVALARSWLRTWMDKLGVAEAVASDAVLVLSELATNAVVHSRSSGPHGCYMVRVRRGVSRLRLEVTDAGGGTEPRARRNGADPLATGPLEESGHGLALVEAFTTRWWIRGDSTSRTVYAEIALDGST